MVRVDRIELDGLARLVLQDVAAGRAKDAEAAAFLALDVTAAAPLGIAAAAVGAILLITGLVGFCPAYGVCKLSTCKAA